MNWISIKDRLPDGYGGYLIAGHEWFGIGIWDGKGAWKEGYIGEFTPDDGTLVNGDFLYDEVMYWGHIPEYPIYGIRMGECKK